MNISFYFTAFGGSDYNIINSYGVVVLAKCRQGQKINNKSTKGCASFQLF